MDIRDSDFTEIPVCEKSYKINKLGQIKRTYKNGEFKILKPYLEPHGYIRHLLLDKTGKQKKFYLHRLLGLTFFKNPENLPCIDHRDHNRANNNLSNLHFVSYKQNSRNRKVSKNNSTGYRGVRYVKNKKSFSFVASWSDEEGKERKKCFNVKKYGYDKALEMAIEKRREMEDLFYNYS